jgi:hypothetical protein
VHQCKRAAIGREEELIDHAIVWQIREALATPEYVRGRTVLYILGHRMRLQTPFKKRSGPLDDAKGRSFAAWLGLVPKQESTGGKQKLLGISKRGNDYLRRLFVSGARAVLQCRDMQSSGLSTWLSQLASRVHTNVAAVALANKMARIAWALLAKSETYRPPLSVTPADALACN